MVGAARAISFAAGKARAAAAALGPLVEPLAPAVGRRCTRADAPAVPCSRPLAGPHAARLFALFSSWGKGATFADGSTAAVKSGGLAVDCAKSIVGEKDTIGVKFGEMDVYYTNPATTGPKNLTFTGGGASKEIAGDAGVLYGHTAAALGPGGEAGRNYFYVIVNYGKPMGRRCPLTAAFLGLRAPAPVGPHAVRHLPLRLFATSTGLGGTKPGDSSGGVGEAKPGDSSDGLEATKPSDSSGEEAPLEDKATGLDKKGAVAIRGGGGRDAGGGRGRGAGRRGNEKPAWARSLERQMTQVKHVVLAVAKKLDQSIAETATHRLTVKTVGQSLLQQVRMLPLRAFAGGFVGLVVVAVIVFKYGFPYLLGVLATEMVNWFSELNLTMEDVDRFIEHVKDKMLEDVSLWRLVFGKKESYPGLID